VLLPGARKPQRLQTGLDTKPLDVRSGIEMASERRGESMRPIVVLVCLLECLTEIVAAEQSTIPSPQLCADMKFWVASGYTAASAGTKHFLHQLRVVSSITLIEAEPHEPVTNFLHLNALVAYRLKPYEDHADRLLARKALPPEAKLTDPALRPLLEAAGRVFVTLGRTSAPTA
jgi:hypothetical protein